jgi:dephospho-CoA kinase
MQRQVIHTRQSASACCLYSRKIKQLRIIGITGTLGAGKGTIVDYLTQHHHFQHFSVRAYLSKIIKSKGLQVNRDTLVATANELREANTPSFIAEELYREAKESGTDCIIESIRTVGEVNALHSKGNFYLFAVDADQKLRYSRILERASETDKVSLETFIANELREMNNTDPNKQNLAACMQMADFKFINNDGFDELYRQIDAVLKQITG